MVVNFRIVFRKVVFYLYFEVKVIVVSWVLFLSFVRKIEMKMVSRFFMELFYSFERVFFIFFMVFMSFFFFVVQFIFIQFLFCFLKVVLGIIIILVFLRSYLVKFLLVILSFGLILVQMQKVFFGLKGVMCGILLRYLRMSFFFLLYICFIFLMVFQFFLLCRVVMFVIWMKDVMLLMI